MRSHPSYQKALTILTEAEVDACKRLGRSIAAQGKTTTRPEHYQALNRALVAADSSRVVTGSSWCPSCMCVFHTEWRIALDEA